MAVHIVLRVLVGWVLLACIFGPPIGRRLRHNRRAANHKTTPGGPRA